MATVKRVSSKKEGSIMYDESNNTNLEQFEDILRYFFYDRETNKRVREAIYSKDWIDDFFELNSQKRAWFKISGIENTDESFKRYRERLGDAYSSNRNQAGTLIDNLWNSHRLVDYNTFKNNKIEYKGQEYKLFKFLRKQNILTQSEIEEITHFKTKEEDMYLCISRNVIDYIFMSTNQSYTSCINLHGSYCYWLGLPAMVVDPNRFLAFISKGKVARHYLKRLEFKHFKYTTRSWGLLSNRDRFVLVRNYPSDPLNIRSLVEQAYSIKREEEDCFRSKFEFDAPKLQNGNFAFPYLDRYGYSLVNSIDKYVNRKVFYRDGGYCGSSLDFDGGQDFNDVYDLEDLEYAERYSCSECGYTTSDECELHYDDYESYCSECYWEIYFSCEDCNEHHPSDERYVVGDSYLCNYCFNQSCFECHWCDEYRFNDEMSTKFRSTNNICTICADDYEECETCEDIILYTEIVDNLCGMCRENSMIEAEKEYNITVTQAPTI